MSAIILDFDDEPKPLSPPKYIECQHPQGTKEWLIDRLGVPTGSCFGRILTARGTYSGSADTYMNELLAEWLTGEPLESYKGADMKRGNELEPEAAEQYQFITDNEVHEINFCFADERKLFGVSPDRLVDDNGLLEIKCPKANTMVEYKLDGELPQIYKPQVQGQMWVMEKEWCDFYCYHPKISPLKVRVERDEQYIDLLSESVEAFVGKMLKQREKLS